MANLGTYGTLDFPFFPANILPEPGDPISWDWMDAVSRFSLRYMRYVIYETSQLADLGTDTFDYSALQCDYFPPFIKVYWWDEDPSVWRNYIPTADTRNVNERFHAKEVRVYNIGLGTCKIQNMTKSPTTFKLIAYL